MTSALGQALTEGGRETVGPMLVTLIEEAQADGDLPAGSPAERAELFIALPIGDTQIRRVIGALPEPDKKEATARAERAVAMLRQLA